MQLTRSLAVWLAGTTAVTLGLHGSIQVWEEHEDLLSAARRDMALLVVAIRSGVENALRDEQHPDIPDLLEQLELSNAAIDVFVFDRQAGLIASSPDSETTEPYAVELARRSPIPEVVHVAEEIRGPGLVAVAPIRNPEAAIGQVVIIQSTDVMRADLQTERRAVVTSIAVLIAALSLVLWLVIRQRILQPMSQLVSGIRRFASGDLASRLDMKGGDEVAEIAREFNAMAAALESAHSRIAMEAERHEQLEVDLQRANKLATVGELAAMLAHEIGSPLQVLNGRARVLASRTDLPPEAVKSVEILVTQTDRVDRIVQRLLAFARRKVAALENIDIGEHVRAVVDLLSGEARRRGVRLDLDIREVPRVRADADHVQQVVLNLLQNALRACNRGGTVRIALERSSFATIAKSRDQPSVALTIEDTGNGVTDDVRARLFEPFFTAWDSGKEPGGTGLGLAVVKSIMAEHGGIATVAAARPEPGASFTVHFPAGDVPGTAAS